MPQPGIASNNYAPTDLTNVVGLASGGDHDIALFGTRAPFFTVQPWNRAVTYSKIIPASPPSRSPANRRRSAHVGYQWLLNGTNYPGATNDTLTLRGDPPSQLPTGAFQLVASNSYGVIVSKPAKVTLVIPLDVALDTTNLVWTTTGSTPWYGQTNYTHDGLDAARSGGIGGSQESDLLTTLATKVPGNVTFWWKVSSEQFFDTLEFRINGTVQAVISGQVNWQQASFPVPAGTNLLEWRYSKDPTFDVGLDAGFVDQFAFVYTPTPPAFTVPAGGRHRQTVNMEFGCGTLCLCKHSQRLTYNLPMAQKYGNSCWQLQQPACYRMDNVTRATRAEWYVRDHHQYDLRLKHRQQQHRRPSRRTVLVPQHLGSPQLLPNGSLQLTSTDANGGLSSNRPTFPTSWP